MQKMNLKHYEQTIKSMTKTPELNDWRLTIGLVKPNSRVLSIGCGSGREVKYLVEIGCNVTAIDIDPECVRLSKEIEPNAKYIVGDALNLNIDIKFDYVICLNRTINYLLDQQDKVNLVNKMYSFLKPHGRLIISTTHFFSSIKSMCVSVLPTRTKLGYYPRPSQIGKWFEGLEGEIFTSKIDSTQVILLKK